MHRTNGTAAQDASSPAVTESLPGHCTRLLRCRTGRWQQDCACHCLRVCVQRSCWRHFHCREVQACSIFAFLLQLLRGLLHAVVLHLSRAVVMSCTAMSCSWRFSRVSSLL